MGARRALWRVDGERGKASVRYILCSWLKSVRGEGGVPWKNKTNKQTSTVYLIQANVLIPPMFIEQEPQIPVG